MKILSCIVLFLGFAGVVGAEEAKPATSSPETWLTIRALSAETQAMEERFGRLNAELSLARQAFMERRGQWDAAVADLARTMKMDVTKCVPDPVTKTWVPRRPDVKDCAVPVEKKAP